MGTIARLLGIGWYVGMCIAVGAVLGMWTDNEFGLNPLFTLTGIGTGILAAIFGMYRMLKTVLAYISDTD